METQLPEPPVGATSFSNDRKMSILVITQEGEGSNGPTNGAFGKYINQQIAVSSAKVIAISFSQGMDKKFVEKAVAVIETSEKTQLVVKKAKILTICLSKLAWKISGKFDEKIADEDVLSAFVDKAKLRREYAIVEVAL
jgi:hypothetical protein